MAVANLGIVAALIAGSLFTGATAVSGEMGNHGAGHRQSSDLRVSKASSTPCDRYAAPWGSKHGNGSAARPVHGPYRLVRMLRSGQTGCLRTGMYHEEQTPVTRPNRTPTNAPRERATSPGRGGVPGRRGRPPP